MRPFRRRPGRASHWAVLVAASSALSSTQALAAPSWIVKGRGSGIHLETLSQTRGGRLVLGCEDVAKLYVYVPGGWDGSKLESTFIDIDGRRTAVTVDGVHAAAILSDRPKEAVGVTTSLLSRMKRGKKLVISGSAATKVPPRQLTFSLAGAGPAITAFERRCPAMRKV